MTIFSIYFLISIILFSLIDKVDNSKEVAVFTSIFSAEKNKLIKNTMNNFLFKMNLKVESFCYGQDWMRSSPAIFISGPIL